MKAASSVSRSCRWARVTRRAACAGEFRAARSWALASVPRIFCRLRVATGASLFALFSKGRSKAITPGSSDRPRIEWPQSARRRLCFPGLSVKSPCVIAGQDDCDLNFWLQLAKSAVRAGAKALPGWLLQLPSCKELSHPRPVLRITGANQSSPRRCVRRLQKTFKHTDGEGLVGRAALSKRRRPWPSKSVVF